MTNTSRRSWLAALAGTSSLAIASRIANQYGLIPPVTNNLFAPGESLTYAAQRLITTQSRAREFPASHISDRPLANGEPPKIEPYKKHHATGFKDWQLKLEGLVARPTTFAMDQIKSYPSNTHITQLICEEGWSYIASWTGVPLSRLLTEAGILPQARYILYYSIEPGWFDSIDMADALHPQTLIAYGMNGSSIPLGNGGPLRIRVPRQLGYKSVKYINRIVVTDTLPEPRKAAGGLPYGYSWYAGI